jgi:cytochrome c oxidase subunit 1
MFVSGQSDLAASIFSILTMLVGVPTAIKLFNWVSTLYKGRVSLETPMIWTLNFLANFTVGGVTGLFLAAYATDVHLHDTYFVVAHFHYTMPRRYHTYDGVFAPYHMLSTIGAYILAFGFLFAIYILVRDMFKGERTEEKNPWNGTTLEWTTQTPPIHENFVDVPTVTDRPYEYR